MAVVVPRLHTGQSVRLEVTSYFSSDSMSGKKCLDTGSDALQLEADDGVADSITCPGR